MRVLVLDIGGTHVKAAVPSLGTRLQIPSGPDLTPERLMQELAKRLRGVRYDAVAVGFPGLVVHGRVVREPANLGRGWVGFDFAKALRAPVRVLNDAALQVVGCYRGGRMLYLGLGTGLGSAMVVDGKVEPMELAHLPYKKGRTFEDYIGEHGLERRGRKRWQKEVFEVVKRLSEALEPDYVAIGGGNVAKLSRLPPHTERWTNQCAIRGGVRIWSEFDGNPEGLTGLTLPPRRTAGAAQKSRRRSV